MRFTNTILLSLLAAVTTVEAGCSYVSGNYYCDEVEAVVYSNVGYSGSYKDVTNMDEDSCECTQESVSFSGSNSPLDEELSVHFRGPLKLLQFGVYYPGSGSSSSSNKKRDVAEDEACTTTKHIHHAHKREAAVKVVEVTQTVFVDANGNLVTNEGTTEITSTPAEEATSSAADTSDYQTIDKKISTTSSSSSSSSSSTDSTTTLASSSGSGSGSSSGSSSSSSSSTSSQSTSSSTSSSSSDWNRVAYYEPGSTTNVTFLNTNGGSGSGTWSSCFGNSLSYAASNGVDGASSANALNEVTLKSDEEYCIFSGSECSGDSCGYYRSDIPAYHGFGGNSKIFVFEFEMPHDSSTSGASNPDMPAIWLLNAKVPRTLQYGNSKCSCWSTGCGELDLFEVLTEGQEKLISHLHDGQGSDGSSNGGGGSQDYFARPTSGSFKGAAIFTSDGTIHVVQVDDDSDFGSGLDSSTVNSWLKLSGGTASLSS